MLVASQSVYCDAINAFRGLGPLQDVDHANKKRTPEQVVYCTMARYTDKVVMQQDPEQHPGYLRGWRCMQRPYLQRGVLSLIPKPRLEQPLIGN